jgi:hypothetical protein
MLKQELAMVAWLALSRAAAAVSSPCIYWTDRRANAIGTAGADSAGVDGQHVDFPCLSLGKIGEANLDGTEVSSQSISGVNAVELAMPEALRNAPSAQLAVQTVGAFLSAGLHRACANREAVMAQLPGKLEGVRGWKRPGGDGRLPELVIPWMSGRSR